MHELLSSRARELGNGRKTLDQTNRGVLLIRPYGLHLLLRGQAESYDANSRMAIGFEDQKQLRFRGDRALPWNCYGPSCPWRLNLGRADKGLEKLRLATGGVGCHTSAIVSPVAIDT